ncbi:MAG: hypothetical protein LBT60_06480 [Oscillospiraceae bacterium]|jgi:hypothetical protein|nr:hypothetical protein [Oscillospiraceae bacterium]
MPKSRWLRCFLPVAALGALLALALFFYPELLRLVSPKGYTALALARSGATLSRETEFLRGAWGTDAWAALARESSLSVAELTVTGAADTLSGTASPLPDGLGLRAETFLNRTAGGLASRQILSWGASDFALDVWLSEEELAVSVPQLFHRPIAFEADRFGLMWNDSPLAALFPLPDGLAADGLGLRASDTLETDPLADWRGRLETLAKSADFEAAETDGAGSRIRAALPQAEAGAFLGETLALCRSLTPFEALPGGAETWAELLDGWETVTPTSGEAVFSIDGGHRLRQLTLTVVGDEDALTFSLWLSGETALLDLVSAEITRTRGEQTTALLRLLVSGLVTPSEEGQMTAEVFVDLSYPLGGHT